MSSSPPDAAQVVHAFAPTLVIGLLGGLASGLLGIGGGLLIVPLLCLWVHAPIKTAVGTSLLAVVVTSIVGVTTETLSYPENIHWLSAAILATGAVAGSRLGAWFVERIRPEKLRLLLALVLVIAALKMSQVLGWLASALDIGTGARAAMGEPALSALLLVTGLGAGVVSSLFGIGGGLVAVPALSFLNPDWPFQAARATSLAMVIPAALMGTWLHWRLRTIDLGLARGMLAGCIVGSIAGVLLANRLPGYALQLLFAALLLASAVQLLRPARARA